MLQLYKLF
jgi:hypothetical protein